MKPVIFQLAVKNLLGQPRRTLLTMTAIAMGLATLIMLWAFNDGLHRNMLDNFKQSLIGSLQIHRKGFFENPNLELHIADPFPIHHAITTAGVADWTHRLETFAMLASTRSTVGSFVIGLDPRREGRVTRLPEMVTEGRFFGPDDGYVCVIGAGTARGLEARIGDDLTLVSFDRYGAMVADNFRLIGIIGSGETGIDKGLVLTPLHTLQEFVEMQGAITDIPLKVQEFRLDDVAELLQELLADEDLAILRWHDMFPVMKEWITLHNGFMVLFIGIVLVIVAFGVLNTILLSTLERGHEFGSLMALGNRHREIGSLVLLESFIIAGLGTLSGTLLGLFGALLVGKTGLDLSRLLGDTGRFYVDAVIYPHVDPLHTGASVLAVFVASLLAGLYPAWLASRQRPGVGGHYV